MIEEGKKAPAFEMVGDDGKAVKLSAFKGKPVVLYFYPKDDTPGCTVEAKDFSCLVDQFEKAGAVIIGVSPDDQKSHKKFKDKHELTIKLASDTDQAVANAYGVWVQKSMYGKTYMGVERSTFLIDQTGKIAKAWHKVKVPGHAEAVLAAVKDLA